MKKYLKQAPTLIVIGVTGLAAWPVLFPGGGAAPSAGATRPPAADKAPPPAVRDSGRDPFQVARAAVASPRATAEKPEEATRPSAAKSTALPELPADEDKVLHGMSLVGTFVDGREQVAIIDGKVYGRGESLRKADGSPLPYVVWEVRKDRAVLRRGRRDFVLGFSNVPRAASPRPDGPAVAGKAAPAQAPAQAAIGTASRKKAGPAATRPGGGGGDGGGDAASMLLRLLSGGLGGGSAGGGGLASGGASGSGLPAGPGDSAGSNAGGPGIPINSATIQAGLDALMGKFDDIGRGGVTP